MQTSETACGICSKISLLKSSKKRSWNQRGGKPFIDGDERVICARFSHFEPIVVHVYSVCVCAYGCFCVLLLLDKYVLKVLGLKEQATGA